MTITIVTIQRGRAIYYNLFLNFAPAPKKEFQLQITIFDTGKGIAEKLSFVYSNRQHRQSFQAICIFMMAINSNFHNFVFLQRKTHGFLTLENARTLCILYNSGHIDTDKNLIKI